MASRSTRTRNTKELLCTGGHAQEVDSVLRTGRCPSCQQRITVTSAGVLMRHVPPGLTLTQ